jgi:hypothetical protein
MVVIGKTSDYSLFNYVPKILSLPLAQAKNGNEQFWRKKFYAVNGKA